MTSPDVPLCAALLLPMRWGSDDGATASGVEHARPVDRVADS